MACLTVALSGAGLLVAGCDGESPNQPGPTSGSGASGGTGGAGGAGGDGGQGGQGGYEWPVETYPIEITPSDDWKNELTFPYDPFMVSTWDPGAPRWVKFTVLMHDPTKVYYQESNAFPFHGPFATARLDPFFGMTLEEYNQVSLYAAGQKAILGAVLISPNADAVPEYGIQLVRQDAYHPEMARIVLDLVKNSIVDAPPGTRSFYFPTFEQQASATANSAFFESAGFPVSSAERWINGDSCYAPGWAIGRLKYVAPDQIEAAYASGALRPEDVLLTDSVPAEVPYVAGILSLSPSTPNSHAALLATSFGIPFAYVGNQETAEHARTLDGKEIALRAALDWGTFCRVALVDAEGKISAADRAALLDLKRPANLGLSPKQPLGAYYGSTENLGPADIIHFGGKAANYGMLRDAIPQNSDEAMALSFDLWDEFLDQTMPGGSTLRAEIEAKLSGYTYPPDLVALKVDLAEIRDRIRKDAVFTAGQQQAIQAALTGFSPTRKIRFRSSTNVEDSAEFTGAGLYDSYSGCLADDTDADTTGPSHCDAGEPEERGVYRAIRRVYASFYNDNAFLARLLYGVNEAEVGMGVLVHYSYPDPQEMANGVATLGRELPFAGTDIKLVTQLGAVSVTNPEGGALPEVVRVNEFDSVTYLDLVSTSTLVPLGARVMAWEDDYHALAALLFDVETRFKQEYPGKSSYMLDFEYKKMSPGKLVVKQVREVALPDTTPSLTPYLIDDPRRVCTFQGEFGDIFANHRLKIRADLSTPSKFLTPAALGSTLFGNSSLSFLASGGASVATLTGTPASWPGASHDFNAGTSQDSFTNGAGASLRTFTLTTEQIPELLPPSVGPLTALRDFIVTLEATYATPVPVVDYTGSVSTVSSEVVRLDACPAEGQPIPGAILQQRSYTVAPGVTVTPSFYWPPAPTGFTAGYTAPLYKWVETRIVGLTSAPLVLKGYYSQTYRPGHHNFWEEFMFEPRLEEGIAPAQIAELEARGIRAIYLSAEPDGSQLRVWRVDTNGALLPMN
ncbi:PEP/pyruvate-binding domain-containing protein [Chondromyces crocatus]|nr:PEP/pyruvate-binding domain-containing protein [Chondromyces crocatus]